MWLPFRYFQLVSFPYDHPGETPSLLLHQFVKAQVPLAPTPEQQAIFHTRLVHTKCPHNGCRCNCCGTRGCVFVVAVSCFICPPLFHTYCFSLVCPRGEGCALKV
mmetsp:Transcript_112018/g.217052  ORF Transcript_112018/g.217052 Transcript_112018/m.217052 type:complete len:105 (+) Transcript_112018:563-877(+)